MADKPLVYVILGAAGSGRRAILADLIEAGLLPDDRPAVMLSDAELPDPLDATLPNVTRWTWSDEFIIGTLPKEPSHIFFVTDGRRNPVDQLETFKTWNEAQGGDLARIISVVNCQLAEKHAPLLAWYEACVHFSDVVLLTKREGVGNKWLSDFRLHFDKQFYPCLFEMVKDSHTKNPALVLDPQARRMTHVFDAEQDWIFTDAEGEEIDEQEETEGEEEVEAKVEEDPYFIRDATLKRTKKIPDIGKFLTA